MILKLLIKTDITYIILGGIMNNNITVEGLKNDINGYTIIDLRRIESYNNGNISMSKNIPFNQLIIEPNKYLKKDISYCLYCQKGTKSIKACQILSNQGYRVVNITGGYQAWILQK